MPTEEEIQELLNSIKIYQIQAMLRILAISFTKQTKFLEVPKGTFQYKFVDPDPRFRSDDPRGYKETIVDLIEFFGMYVGYEPKRDVLVMWKP